MACVTLDRIVVAKSRPYFTTTSIFKGLKGSIMTPLLCDLSQSDDKIDRNASARESKIEMYWSEKSDIDLI